MPDNPTKSDLQLLTSKLDITSDYLMETLRSLERYLAACAGSITFEAPTELTELRNRIAHLRQYVNGITI